MEALCCGREGVCEYPLVPQPEQPWLASVGASARLQQRLLLCHSKCGRSDAALVSATLVSAALVTVATVSVAVVSRAPVKMRSRLTTSQSTEEAPPPGETEAPRT
eukprot:scaffold16041_cov37-Phaeocystis_antarctica.AAC.4